MCIRDRCKDQDKDFSYKDQDKDQDFGVKDKDKDQDLSRKDEDKDKDFGLTKQTSNTDTNTRPTTITNSFFIMPDGSTDKNAIIYTRQNVRDKIQNTHNNNKNLNDKYVSVSQMSRNLFMNSHSYTRLHFSITRVSKSPSFIFARCGIMMKPNTRSTGAEVAVVQNVFANRGRRRGFWVHTSVILTRNKQAVRK